jgi:hypothetical protein
MRVRAVQKSSGGTWSYISGVDYNPLSVASLLGPTSQDLVFAITPTQLRGYGIEADSSGLEALQISKLIVSNAFDFGVPPDLSPAPSWQPLPKGITTQLFTPYRGYEPFEVESQISINWSSVTQAVAFGFREIIQVGRWPFYLYDEDGDVWPWKLEHVVLKDYAFSQTGDGYYDLTASFLRLKHYP